MLYSFAQIYVYEIHVGFLFACNSFGVSIFFLYEYPIVPANLLPPLLCNAAAFVEQVSIHVWVCGPFIL